MRERLLDLLICPACRSGLELRADPAAAEDVRIGTLACGGGHAYPISEYVPSFAREHGYMDAFSAIRRSPSGQLPKSGALDRERITRDEFRAQTQTDPESLRGKTVLDAGCGDGRFMELLAAHGARVVGVDLDRAGLEQARRGLSRYEDAHFVQADLYHLPFRRASFDFIYSLGVLHHTPDPKAAFFSLAPLLKAGGGIAVWVYPKSERTPVSDLIRPVTTRIPARYLYWVAVAVTRAYGPLLKLPRLKTRLQAILYNARLPWHEEAHWRVHSFLDWYGPRYQFKFSPEELEGWVSEAGLVEVVRCPYESSVRGVAPPSRPGGDRLL